MKNIPRHFLITALAGVGLLFSAGCQSATNKPAADVTAAPPSAAAPVTTPTSTFITDTGIYVFGWGELPQGLAKPRGGSSRGALIKLAPERPLPLAEIATATDDFARDRAAILALAGDYKVSFHFMETLGFTDDDKPKQSYYSWATEHIRVIEDTARFISLQHTLVMFFKKDDGTISEPTVMKHWRQDWTYEPSSLHTFRGDNTWAKRSLSSTEASGAWTQSVWQVDDSPRYTALGRWAHDGNRSIWTGENDWRPLPRREHSVRNDYSILEGSHRIVLTPTGWLHEQLNWKRVAGEPAPASYVGEEWGLDRYERIIEPSLSAADVYWEKTGNYWAVVRHTWTDLLAQRERIKQRSEVDGKKLFEVHFDQADKIATGQTNEPAVIAQQAKVAILRFIE